MSTKENFCCSECAKKTKDKFLTYNLLFGLWSPKGIVWMPIVTFYNLYNRLFHRVEKIDNQITEKFLDEQRGTLRLAENKLEVIKESIRRLNDFENTC